MEATHMTQKEKLYYKWQKLENELKKFDNSHRAWEMAYNLEPWQYIPEAKKYTVAELEGYIADTERKIEEAKQAKAVEEYFATPEGAAKKAELEEAREANRNAFLKMRDEYLAKARALIEPILPENWKMYATDVTYINIYLEDATTCKKVFGHEFELRFNEDWDWNDKYIHTISANIGTMGSFNPLKDMSRVMLYKVFADITANASLMEELLSIMTEAAERKNQFHDTADKIREQLNNPIK